jgi:spore coat polysaccharide biosynthesis protein SpsF
MKLTIVVQARCASTRLPGKVLLPVAGAPLLERMLVRVRAARHCEHVIVATTTEPADDAIVALCERLGVAHLRGDPQDCLARHLQAARCSDAGAVVKIPSDCPLIDPRVIDEVLSTWHADPLRYDYLSNLHPASWPDGQDVEVIATEALERAGREATAAFDREHTTPFIWTRPEQFRLGNVLSPFGQDHSRTQRWVVDWVEDYRLVCEIYARLLERCGPCFAVGDVLQLLAREPELLRINAARHGYQYWAQGSIRPVAGDHPELHPKETTV